jgi:hypothetical protein
VALRGSALAVRAAAFVGAFTAAVVRRAVPAVPAALTRARRGSCSWVWLLLATNDGPFSTAAGISLGHADRARHRAGDDGAYE